MAALAAGAVCRGLDIASSARCNTAGAASISMQLPACCRHSTWQVAEQLSGCRGEAHSAAKERLSSLQREHQPGTRTAASSFIVAAGSRVCSAYVGAGARGIDTSSRGAAANAELAASIRCLAVARRTCCKEGQALLARAVQPAAVAHPIRHGRHARGHVSACWREGA